jgi:hypothetical protein
VASLEQTIAKALAEAAKARAEAEVATDEPDVWDLLALDPAEFGPTWERYLQKPRGRKA